MNIAKDLPCLRLFAVCVHRKDVDPMSKYTHQNTRKRRKEKRRILSGTYFQLVHTTFKFKLDKVNCIDNFKQD